MPKLPTLGLALLAILLFTNLGCINVTVVDHPSGVDLKPIGPRSADLDGEVRDLVITAVDLDPPLRGDLSTAPEQITLLAVVENKGTVPAGDVMVEAKVFALGSAEPLVSRISLISRLAAGESRVVRFSSIPPVPLFSAYVLTVAVQPMAGEAALANNTQTFQIRVTSPR